MISAGQVLDGVLEHYRHGRPKGDPTGWASVDGLYRVALQQWTLITGTPQSGKSEWLDALMVNLAKQNVSKPWQFAVFSPENAPIELHVEKILEKYVGKPFDPGPTQRMTEDEVQAGIAWMDKRFRFVKVESPTVDSILGEVVHFCTYASEVRNTGIVIDPWNQMDHQRPVNMTETEYISHTLSRLIAFVRDMNIHLWLVAHPRIMQKDKDGKRGIPTPYDVSGSAHWFNKADNCITVHRDLIEGNQNVEIHVQKVRFKHVGRIGLADLRYDKVTGRYFDVPKAVDTDRYRRQANGDD